MEEPAGEVGDTFMKTFILGFVLGAAMIYWSGQRSDVLVDAVSGWVFGAADNYRGDPGADSGDGR